MKEYSYWWDTANGSREHHSTASKPCPIDPAPVDVAIVGAGYTGLSAARQLAQAGASVAVVERERIGWGASSRNAGQVLTGLRLDPATLVSRFGEVRARELFGVSLAAIDGLEKLINDEKIACEYERTGHIQAAWKPAHYDAFRKEQALLDRVFRHPVTLVPRSAQRSEVATDRYHGLLVDERSAALNPARFVDGLAAAAVRVGVAIHEGVSVERIARSAARWRVTTDAGEIDAGDVLLATNGYTDRAAPALQRRLVPIGSYIIATEPLGDLGTNLIPRWRTAFDSKHFLFYFRLTADNRLIFGGRAAFGQPDADATRQAAAILQRGLATIFPQLSGTVIEYAWGGNVAFTRDQMPRAGRLDDLWFAGGYCGHGVAMATYLGSLVARRMAGEPVEHPLLDDHFPPIPLYDGRPWFLPLVGAYYKVKDLVE